jgi:hypothetical protein
LRSQWKPVFQSTWKALERSIAGRRVGLLIHDSEPTYECERFEIETALHHADQTLAVFSNSDWSGALRELSQERGGSYYELRESPRHSFYPGSGVGLSVFRSR